MKVKILTVSSKGQISIPNEIRKATKIKQGDKLVAYAMDDFIVLKQLYVPSADEFKNEMKRVQEEVKAKGIKEEEIDEIIKSARKENRDKNRD